MDGKLILAAGAGAAGAAMAKIWQQCQPGGRSASLREGAGGSVSQSNFYAGKAAAAAVCNMTTFYRATGPDATPTADRALEAEAVYDIAPFLQALESGVELDATILATCKNIADSMRDTGILVIKDPRVSSDDNDTFTALMQRYYSQEVDALMEDARPDIGYQVGVTPEFVETSRCAHDTSCQDKINSMPEADRPLIPKGSDPKWRFFWRVGERPEADETEFADLNAPPVVPKAFEGEWKGTMDGWGNKVLRATEVVAEMLAIGLGEDRKSLLNCMKRGPHLLAPTGSDLAKYAKKDTIFAGWHTDLNFITIHGKSNYPGLSVWKRDETKMAVKVPKGCLLLQAGKQLEYLTGGYIEAGFHEVAVNERTQKAVDEAQAAGRSLWRISSTMFTTVCHDTLLQPMGRFAKLPAADKYPPIKAGHQVANELKAIGMMKDD